MQIAENIVIDQGLQERIQSDALVLTDYLLLALANCTAGLFPCAITYIGAQQQAVETPAVFVDYYSLSNQQKLNDVSQYEFGFEITYIPVDPNSTAELSGAIFSVQQNLYRLPCGSGEFVCYHKKGDITDGLAHVTGTVSVWESAQSDDLIIQRAEKELRT